MNNQPKQLQLEFAESKTIRVIRYGDTRARDSEGRYKTEMGSDGNTEERLREQLHILRINSGIWLENKNKEIIKLKEELKKYKNDISN